jgi:hypothetical protein
VSQGTQYPEHTIISDNSAIVTLIVAAFIGACIGDCGYKLVKQRLSLGGNGEIDKASTGHKCSASNSRNKGEGEGEEGEEGEGEDQTENLLYVD